MAPTCDQGQLDSETNMVAPPKETAAAPSETVAEQEAGESKATTQKKPANNCVRCRGKCSPKKKEKKKHVHLLQRRETKIGRGGGGSPHESSVS